MRDLLGTCSRLQCSTGMRTYRSFRLSGSGGSQLNKMRGLLIKWAGGAQRCSELQWVICIPRRNCSVRRTRPPFPPIIPTASTPPRNICWTAKYNLTIPTFLDNCSTIDQVVDVEYYVGGCPPHPSFVGKLIGAILAGDLPPAGSWLTSGKAVCDSCKRNPAITGQERLPVGEIKRTIDGRPDEDKCLLQQGYMCFGPITQGDCGASCLNVNIPCRGCGGPIPGIKDFGARCVSTLASSMATEEVAAQFIEKYNNMAKMFYRYSHTASKLNHRVAENKEKQA